jgi:hypothetical protein
LDDRVPFTFNVGEGRGMGRGKGGRGMNDIEEMNLIEYFNRQIKAFKAIHLICTYVSWSQMYCNSYTFLL